MTNMVKNNKVNGSEEPKYAINIIFERAIKEDDSSPFRLVQEGTTIRFLKRKVAEVAYRKIISDGFYESQTSYGKVSFRVIMAEFIVISALEELTKKLEELKDNEEVLDEQLREIEKDGREPEGEE